jgi:two-component system, sensor histidine kinase and response regulator
MSQQVILCVDDEIIVLDALNEQLHKAFGPDFIIESAESAEEALDIFAELTEEGMEFPVILTDFIMPVTKGDELLEKFHIKSPLSKKIMLTGQASLEGVSNAVNKADLYRYINKPWDRNDMILTIKEAIKSYNLEKAILEKNKELSLLNESLEQKVEERTHQLEELNKTKDKFFSIIAHDLKNPFNTLLGFTELMRINFDRYTKEQIKQYINILYETADSGYSLLKNLLEWSRSQTGSLKRTPQVVDLSTITKDVMQFLEISATKKQINIVNNLAEDVTVFSDLNMIHTTIRNLISNAIKYTNKGGTIEINSKKDGNMLIFSVQDNGIGIPAENIAKLFRIDISLSTKGTSDESGTGLGLLLCKEFVEKNGGEIWVESKLNAGSQFFFTVPLKDPGI